MTFQLNFESGKNLLFSLIIDLSAHEVDSGMENGIFIRPEREFEPIKIIKTISRRCLSRAIDSFCLKAP